MSQLITTNNRNEVYSNEGKNTSFQGRYIPEQEDNFHGNLSVEQSEEGIVAIIHNLIDFALEDHLTEEQLGQMRVLLLDLCLTSLGFLLC